MVVEEAFPNPGKGPSIEKRHRLQLQAATSVSHPATLNPDPVFSHSAAADWECRARGVALARIEFASSAHYCDRSEQP